LEGKCDDLCQKLMSVTETIKSHKIVKTGEVKLEKSWTETKDIWVDFGFSFEQPPKVTIGLFIIGIETPINPTYPVIEAEIKQIEYHRFQVEIHRPEDWGITLKYYRIGISWVAIEQ